jgi:hypothetical protein
MFPRNDQTGTVILLGGIGLLVVVLLAYTGEEVTAQMPRVIAYLKTSKAYCENHATEAMKDPRLQNSLPDGQRLYGATRAEFDGVIAFMQAALARGFNDSDPAEINQQLQVAGARMQAFLAWPPRQGSATAAGPLDFANLALELYKIVKAEDDQTRAMLRDDLEKCRLREWNQLGR